MAITVDLPELGEGVDSVDVVSVLVAVGDEIKVDQSLIEVETEKASVEVPSTAAGTVLEIHVKEGNTIGEKAAIVTLDAVDQVAAPAPLQNPRPRPSPNSRTTRGQRRPEGDRAGRADRSTAGDVARRHGRGPAAPTVRRFAREVGVDITAGPRVRTRRASHHRRYQGAFAGEQVSRGQAARSRRPSSPISPFRADSPRAHVEGPPATAQPGPGLAHRPPGHPPRAGRHHRHRSVQQDIRGTGRGSRR